VKIVIVAVVKNRMHLKAGYLAIHTGSGSSAILFLVPRSYLTALNSNDTRGALRPQVGTRRFSGIGPLDDSSPSTFGSVFPIATSSTSAVAPRCRRCRCHREGCAGGDESARLLRRELDLADMSVEERENSPLSLAAR
jgi:hypothetical protein